MEVSVDGAWQPARLAAQDTIDTWRQWVYDWDATPGEHTLAVRATDQTGATQTATPADPGSERRDRRSHDLGDRQPADDRAAGCAGVLRRAPRTAEVRAEVVRAR